MLEIPSHSNADNLVCEAIDCYNVATEVVEVSAGKFGTIRVDLCHQCAVVKFEAS